MKEELKQITMPRCVGAVALLLVAGTTHAQLSIVGPNAYCADADLQGFFYVNVVAQFPEFGTADGWSFEWEPAAFIDEPTGTGTDGQGINLVGASGEVTLEVMAINPDGDTLYGERDLSYFDPFVLDVGPDLALCEAEGTQLSAVPSDLASTYTYAWQPPIGLDNPDIPNPTLTTNESLTYTVTAWSMLGSFEICEAQATIDVEVLFPPFDLGPDEVACEGEVVTVASGLPGTVNHDWNLPGVGNGPIVDLTASGLVHLTATDPNGCVQSDSLEVTFSPGPDVDLGPDTTGCAFEGIALDATPDAGSLGPFFFDWSDGTSGAAVHTVHTSGAYSVVVTDVAGCQGADEVVVTALASPTFNTPTDTAFCFTDYPEATYQIYVPAGFSSYAWSTGDTGPAVQVTSAGSYDISVTNAIGCSTEATIEVEEFCGDPLLFIPSAFTPDGNQLNETWRVEGRNLVDFELFVADRWGQIVWQTDVPGVEWNGTGPAGTHYVDPGAYMWRARYRYMLSPDGVMSGWEERTGTVLVIR